jgi:tetraacyldisaccharide 4'-kinase
MPFSRHYRILQWRIKRRLDHYEARITDLLYGRVKAKGRLWILWWFLQGFEWLFGLIVSWRLWLYQNRILKQQYLGCMVVVIGNITVGGTGKTPVVEKFARELMARGRRVAILSRGYKRREAPLLKKIFSLFDPEVSAPVVVGDGTGKIRCDWKRAGDEPYMLAQNLPGAIVIVDKNRVKAGAYAIRKFGADTLLLDDGFQYLPLKSRMQLVLVDQTNPFGNGAMLPRGILREGVSALKRASFVFITKSDGAPSDELLKKIKQHAPNVSPIICAHCPKKLMTLDGARSRPLEILNGAKVFAFSGIAVPESFEGMLKKAGAKIVQSFQFTDHYAYEPEDIEQIVRTAEGAETAMIVTTEKDAVRLPFIQSRLPVYYLRMEVEILSGAKDFGEAIERITGVI